MHERQKPQRTRARGRHRIQKVEQFRRESELLFSVKLDRTHCHIVFGRGANPHHYVEMAEFGLLQESDGGELDERWGAVSNLDQFFSTIYSYYYSKGLPTMCVTGVTNLLTLGFTIVLSTCLFALVDYAALLECRDESSCHALGDYVTREMLSRYPVRGALAMCYFALFFAYWAWSAVSLALSLRDAAEMHRFFVERLGVSTRELQTMTWHEVVERVVRLQESGEYKIAIHRRALSAHDIACRVMRKENYLIAFINQGILALHVPVPRALARALRAGRAGRAARRRDRAGRGRDARSERAARAARGRACLGCTSRRRSSGRCACASSTTCSATNSPCGASSWRTRRACAAASC